LPFREIPDTLGNFPCLGANFLGNNSSFTRGKPFQLTWALWQTFFGRGLNPQNTGVSTLLNFRGEFITGVQLKLPFLLIPSLFLGLYFGSFFSRKVTELIWGETFFRFSPQGFPPRCFRALVSTTFWGPISHLFGPTGIWR